MAEQVQAALDQMVAPLRDLMDRSIFTEDEIKATVARRRESEYLLRRRAARKKDFLVYIEQEQMLEELRVLRTQRRKRDHRHSRPLDDNDNDNDNDPETTSTPKKEEQHIGDVHIIQHIHLLFVRAIRKFRSDLGLHLAHVDFCKSQEAWTRLGKVYAEAMQVFPRQMGLWIEAAQHEFFGPRRSIRSARILLQRALRIHRTSEDVWMEYFALELHYAQTLKGRRQILLGPGNTQKEELILESTTKSEILDEDGSSGDYHIATIVFQNAIKAIPESIPFRLRFLDSCRRFPDTHHLMERIQKPLQKDFASHPEAWMARALYEAEKEATATGGIATTKTEQQDDVDKAKSDRPSKKVKANNSVVSILEEAIEAISNDEMRLQAFRFAKRYLEEQAQRGKVDAVRHTQRLIDSIVEESTPTTTTTTKDSSESTSSSELALEIVEHYMEQGKENEGVQVLKKYCSSKKERAPASLWIRWASLSPASTCTILKRAVDCIPMTQPDHLQVLLQYFGALLEEMEQDDGKKKSLHDTFQRILLLAPSASEMVVEDVEEYSFGIASIAHAYLKYLDFSLQQKEQGEKAARRVYHCVLFQSTVPVNETNVDYLTTFIDKCLQLEQNDLPRLRRLYDKVLEILEDTPLEKSYRAQRHEMAVYA